MAEKESTQKKGYTVLLVDDDKFLLDMYSTKFREAGHTTEAAFGGDDALKKLRGGAQFDAILLDMVMPGTDGIELLKNVKAEKLGGNPTLIALSNQGEQSDIDKAKEAGADDYIVKASAIPSEVLAHVINAIEKRG
ncbi:response regulator [Candidatus Kaiserbacteria bacterium CG10_big_fil_rev_8_21_14_0_10_49_17]|uniref:Response regulator n=1 Tax=Candidatus Kaiserbacteria bacterium CG10_big_fil_rev_8_21_14_0_10_49_17 TaxID=1974609 RepID=A0A2M6WE64_9BACT|nr:MAG: response regulator [Candidatus Kaiserbacteria bacterium CG10_big_fil_rev_8_21_14_0_10_49_17]